MDNITESLTGSQCPCWLNEANRCAISDGGVYMPLPHHVLLFCQSACYGQCSQYIKGTKLILDRDLSDRRRMRRYHKHFQIDVFMKKLDNNKYIHTKLNAKTLDVNLYGMKIESENELPADTLIDFEIDKNNFAHSIKGEGVVKWCVQRNNSSHFESGVAFTENTALERSMEKLI